MTPATGTGTGKQSLEPREGLPLAVVERVSRLFWALANPTRVRILHALSQQPLCNGDLAAMLDLTESAVSHQMRDLRLLNIVVVERQGRHTIYRIADEHVRHVLGDALTHASEPDWRTQR